MGIIIKNNRMKTSYQLLLEMSVKELISFLIEESQLETPDITLMKMMGDILKKRNITEELNKIL